MQRKSNNYHNQENIMEQTGNLRTLAGICEFLAIVIKRKSNSRDGRTG